jgi:Fic family protein
MHSNWKRINWANLAYRKAPLEELEAKFLYQSGVLQGSYKHIGDEDKKALPVELTRNDAVNQDFAAPLTSDMLFSLHSKITRRKRNSSADDDKEPFSITKERGYNLFFDWFEQTSPRGGSPLPALTRAGIAHLYFIDIHYFDDGNKRVALSLSEKVLSQALGQPALISLSQTIESQKSRYYEMVEASSQSNEITNWLLYFAQVILDAQNNTLRKIDFLIEKDKLLNKVSGQLNERQEKAVENIFREGLNGFKNGLNAENYISIANTSRATTTRDLQELVKLGVLTRSGKRKSTRYWIGIRPLQ